MHIKQRNVICLESTELACSSVSSGPATRCVASCAWSAPQQLQSQDATGEQAAPGGRQLRLPDGGMTCAAVTAAHIVPYLPSGPFKATATGSDPSDPAVISNAAPKRMSSDISVPLSGTPQCTTPPTHVATSCVPAAQRCNKTTILIAGVADTRGFLAWLVVPSTADGFRATVSGMGSVDGKEGVNFHTFSLPEDRCVRVLFRTSANAYLRASSERSWKTCTSCSEFHAAPLRPPRSGSC
jgi:hypothetical protein